MERAKVEAVAGLVKEMAKVAMELGEQVGRLDWEGHEADFKEEGDWDAILGAVVRDVTDLKQLILDIPNRLMDTRAGAIWDFLANLPLGDILRTYLGAEANTLYELVGGRPEFWWEN